MNYIHDIWVRLRNWLLEGILPRACALCGAPAEALCKGCQELILIPHAQCAVCRARNQYGSVCTGRCRTMLLRGPTRLIWVSNYHISRPVISAFKYRKRSELAEPLAYLLAQKLRTTQPQLNPAQTVIIPIPMHPKKERARGYNQAALLAEKLAQETGFVLLPHALARKDAHAPQALQESKKDRIENMRHSFSFNQRFQEAIRGKTVIIVDDVITTGATLTAAAETIRISHPMRIIGAAIAH